MPTRMAAEDPIRGLRATARVLPMSLGLGAQSGVMIGLLNESIPKRDTKAWKDRVIVVCLGLGAIGAAAWCGVIAGAAWWFVAYVW